MLKTGLLYHDQKFSEMLNEIYLKMRMGLNLLVKLLPQQPIARLGPFIELYDEILQKPIGAFMVINSRVPETIPLKKALCLEFAKAYIAEIFKKRRESQQMKIFGALLILNELANN